MTKAKKTKRSAAPKVTPNRTLKKLFQVMTPVQARQLVKLAGTSVPHLRHVAAGRRNMSAELAQKLATASQKMPKPLLLNQVELCHACKICPIRQKPRRHI